MIYDVIIVGGGPAGITSAIYAAKREMNTLLIEKGPLGGYMLLTNNIENYPGFLRISGPDLAGLMEEQVESLDVDIVKSEVVNIHVGDSFKKVSTPQGEYRGKSLILAVGGGHKKLEVKGEKEFTGRGVSYCATCDAPFFKGKTVAVVGGGNSAIADALYLSEISKKTYLIHRRETLRAEEARQKELKKRGVRILVNTAVEEITGDKLVNGIRIRSIGENTTKDIPVNGVFISIGTIPHSELAKEAGIKLDERQFIQVDRGQETNIEGVYAAGDVTGGVLQISTAVGEGCIAALSAYKHVKKPYWG
ncbi:MAG: thioredoxin-disulfide reductase [Candidatus Altiarchaeota archaeon]|nr:thioredoxin-disulfide reductase [Candidatus Altiarchaeota archaeon]